MSQGKLVVVLEPVRRSRHDIQHVNTITSCLLDNHLVAVNAEVVTYEEAIETRIGVCPPLCELGHNTMEQLSCDVTSLARKEKPMR